MASSTDTIKLVVDMGSSAAEVKEVTKAVDDLGKAATAAAGKPGAGGQGIQGVSYAFQDFLSVLTGGGGITRALGAVTNNFDQLAKAAGATVDTAAKLSLAFTGFTAALPILLPLLEQFWKALSGGEEGKGPEPVVKALSEAEGRLKRIRDELEKIGEFRPPEGLETEQLVSKFLGISDRERVLRGTAAALAASPEGAQMTAEEKRMAKGIEVGLRPGQDAPTRAYFERIRTEFQNTVGKRLEAENRRRAEEIVGLAPLQEPARAHLGRLAAAAPGGFPGGFAAHLAELEPGVQRRLEAEEQDALLDAEARKERREAAARRAAQAGKEMAEVGPGVAEAAEAIRLRAAAEERAAADRARAKAAFDERGQRAVEAANKRGIGLVPEMGGVRAVQAMQRQIAEQTGAVPMLGEVAEMMKRAKEGERGAMMDFVRAVVEANMGTGNNIAILRQGVREVRRETEQMGPPMRNGGK